MSGDDFFGGSLTPPPTPAPNPGGTPLSGPPPSRPGAPINGTYPQYGAPTPRPPARSGGLQPLIIIVVVAIVAAVGTFWLYRTYFADNSIQLPSEFRGAEKMDEDSPLTDAVEAGFAPAKEILGDDVELSVGLYAEGQEMFVVAVANKGTGDRSEQDQFFSAFAEGADLQLRPEEVDPGSQGGRIQCAQQASRGYCAWLTEDAFGVLALNSTAVDAATATREMRELIDA